MVDLIVDCTPMRPAELMHKKPVMCSLAMGALHAALFGLSFPPVYAWPLAFVAIWPLLFTVWKTPKPARSAIMVALAVLPMWLLQHRWMIDVTAAGSFFSRTRSTTRSELARCVLAKRRIRMHTSATVKGLGTKSTTPSRYAFSRAMSA